MVDENLTDEQQAEQIRRWLRQNGGFIFGGIVLGLGLLFGWYQYQAWQESRLQQASDLYAALSQALADARPDDAQELAERLAEDFDRTPYVDQARLALAKMELGQNDFETAATYLADVISAPGSPELAEVARVRLARIRLHQEQYEAALDALSELDPNSGFVPRFHEVRGDVYAAMGRAGDAREAYTEALAADQSGLIDRTFVQAKLDSLGVVEAPAAAAEQDDAPAAESETGAGAG